LNRYKVLDKMPEEQKVLLQCSFEEPEDLGQAWQAWIEQGMPPVWVKYETIDWQIYRVGDTIDLGANGDLRVSGLYRITRIEPTRESVTIGDITGRLIGWIEIDPRPVSLD
jgi:hypothetical protein